MFLNIILQGNAIVYPKMEEISSKISIFIPMHNRVQCLTEIIETFLPQAYFGTLRKL